MNEVRHHRLQNQIHRLVATYYQREIEEINSEKPEIDSENKPEPKSDKNPFNASLTHTLPNYGTITRCELNPDGSFVKIYVSIWGTPTQQAKKLKEFKRHVPTIRSRIAKNIRMRVIPQIAIIQDLSYEKAEGIVDVLK